MGLLPPRRPRKWLKRSSSSYSSRGIAQLHSVERCRPLKPSDDWDGSRTWVGTACGALRKRRWLPKGSEPMQAHTSCIPWQRHVAPLPTGPSSPQPPFSLRASRGWGKSPPSAAEDCDRVRYPTGGLIETNGGFRGTYEFTSGSGSSGSGKRMWVVKSSSAARPTWKNAWLASSRAQFTPATVAQLATCGCGVPAVERPCHVDIQWFETLLELNLWVARGATCL